MLIRNFSCSLLLVACSCLLVIDAQSAETSNPINKLDAFLEGLQTYSAAFEQQLFNEAGEELEKSIGVFYMRRPGMFHWAYWEPYSQIIISDSLTLWIYDEDLEQVIIRNISNEIESSPAAILGGDININEHYVVIEMETTNDINWLELTPRNIESQYESIRLGFKENNLLKMLLFDNLGQRNLITFLDSKRNTQLNLKLFSFSPPEGIDIIDNRY